MKIARVAVSLVVAVSVLTPGNLDVAEAQTTAADLCDVGSVPQFSDIEAGDYGADYIRCMRALRLSRGRGDGSYGAGLELTRAQMASFLVRLWQDVLGKGCPQGVETPFVDVAGNTHEQSIDCLYGLDITMGTTAVTYGPAEKLKASQISLFLVRIYEKAGNSCDVPGDGLDRAVACLAALRAIPSLVEGSSFATVTRDQMAVYMIGLWHNMVGRGLPPQPPRKPAEGTYTAVSAGSYLSCGLLSDGTVECWGDDEHGQLGVPDGVFSTVSAGGGHLCALRPHNTIECWGNNERRQASEPGGLFNAISAGGDFSCGLRTDGTVECWGVNNYGQANEPGGRFSTVSAGRFHSCGLRTDGTVRCWGQKEYGQVKVPGGEFSAVSAGGYHSCGLRSDGNVECWGRNQHGQVDVPGGRFSAVSAGGEHSCGLRTDKTIECWGVNKFGQVNAPSGRFSAVSAGRFHSCGLRTDRTIRCWGNNRLGEVDAPGG